MTRLCLPAASFLVVAMFSIASPVFNTTGFAQGISSGGQRAFVTGFTPVVGPRGVVGGIDVNTDGVLALASTIADSRSKQFSEQMKDHRGVAGAPQARILDPSPLRMVSLARLETAIEKSVHTKAPLSDDILFLAGLQRIQFVYACPESGDIVIAGPADGWTSRNGQVVGIHNHQAVLHLDDLLDVLQSPTEAFHGSGISCSIDPTEEGSRRLQNLLRQRDLKLDPTGRSLMEQAMGEQLITLTGIRQSSHFARILVGSDYLMKRIAMGLDPSPIANLPSYLDVVKNDVARVQVLAPRFWLSPQYDIVEKSADNLIWHFDGPGLQAMTEHGYLSQEGKLVNTGRPDPHAQQWVDDFSHGYSELAKKKPVFGQLSGCVDLAVVAAIVSQNDLVHLSRCPLLLLTDPHKIQGQEFSIPTRVSSTASVTRGRKGRIVSVSGGVDLNIQDVLDTAVVNNQLKKMDASTKRESWWWDLPRK